MLVTTDRMLKKAQEEHYAVPAPDFWDLHSCRTFTDVAEELDSPLILSFAEIHLSMLSIDEAAHLGRYYAERSNEPVALHLDHGMHLDVIEEAIKKGFTSVMIDASSDPYEENVRKTREVVKMARAAGVSVEAEIGHVGVNPGDVRDAQESIYTEAADAVRFVNDTGVDSLAVSVGTSHGLYREKPVLSFERLEELRRAVFVPLVLHGGSSTGDENLSRLAEGGITKINLYTDFIMEAGKTASQNDRRIWPEVLKETDRAVGEVLRHYYQVFCPRQRSRR